MNGMRNILVKRSNLVASGGKELGLLIRESSKAHLKTRPWLQICHRHWKGQKGKKLPRKGS